MKKLLLLCFLNIFLIGCSQSEKKSAIKEAYDINQYIAPEAKDITEANFVEKINSKIRHYEREPIYYFRINKENCLIRTYINDVNIYDDYELPNQVTPIELGNILKSGQQTVTVKMYPVGNLISEDLALKNQPPSTTLSDKATVEISVVMMDNKSDKQFKDEKLITKQASPKEAAGKPYYEFSFTFDAKVPYEFEGWTKGQNLKKLDPKLVEKKAVEYYSMIGSLYENKNIDAILKIDYPFSIRTMSSAYVDKKYLQDLLKEYKNDVVGYDYTMRPIEDYTIEYMGDSKLVRLITHNQRPKLRGGGALLLGYGKSSTYQPGITLYLPEGRDLATQGFMMWK